MLWQWQRLKQVEINSMRKEGETERRFITGASCIFTKILVLLIIGNVSIPKRCRTSLLKYKRKFVIFLLRPNTCQHVMFLYKKWRVNTFLVSVSKKCIFMSHFNTKFDTVSELLINNSGIVVNLAIVVLQNIRRLPAYPTTTRRTVKGVLGVVQRDRFARPNW